MKFITEDDLRQLYQQAPFCEYPYQEGSRLTPGGRQFLLDRNITIGERLTGAESCGCQTQAAAGFSGDTDQEIRVKLALQTIAAAFLQAGVDLLGIDTLLAQEIFTLEQYLAMIERGEDLPETLTCLISSGPDAENSGDQAPIAFAVNGFHAQTEKGREIVKLYYLKCLLLEQEPWLTGVRKEGIHVIITRLSQLICRALGGK